LEDYFSRLEFQMRGSPHSHGLYWVKDAPTYDEDDEESESACVEFIDKFITCERCEEGKMKELIGYQLHKHSHTCKKGMRGGDDDCRFGFPKPPMQTTRILTPFPKNFDPNAKTDAIALFIKIKADLNTRGRHPQENPDFETYLSQIDVTMENYILGKLKLLSNYITRSFLMKTFIFSCKEFH
jgi:hypothetical protein